MPASAQSRIALEAFPSPIRIAGVDLAWGERNKDGVCVIEANRRRARVLAVGLTHGDHELLALAAPGSAHADPWRSNLGL